MRCLGLNYADHAVSVPKPWPGLLAHVVLRRPKRTYRSLREPTFRFRREPALTTYRVPVIFYKPITSLIGPGAIVTVPKVARPVQEHLPDYEVELVIVIGKAAKNVSEAEALDYVLGYTGANDVS